MVRNGLNSMFTELYASILLPIKIPNIQANTIIPIPGNSFILSMALVATSGTPTIRIGTTPNGTDIMDDTIINGTITPIAVQQYFPANTTLYVTVTAGPGAISIRVDLNYNYF